MKIGNIWQIAIGNYKDFKDLKTGHTSGLDILSEKNEIIMEIKNRYNTDNKSARDKNYDKLVAFKNKNPKYTCIYGIINDKKPLGCKKIIIHNGVEIIYYSGRCFLKFIFGDNIDFILKFINRKIFEEVAQKLTKDGLIKIAEELGIPIQPRTTKEKLRQMIYMYMTQNQRNNPYIPPEKDNSSDVHLAIRQNIYNYNDINSPLREVGFPSKEVLDYLNYANQTYELTYDLLELATNHSLDSGKRRKHLKMTDIYMAKQADSVLRESFP